MTKKLRIIEAKTVNAFAALQQELGKARRRYIDSVRHLPALAIRLMRESLTRVLQACEIPELRQDVPWSFVCQRDQSSKQRYVAVKHFPCAAMLTFARMRLGLETSKHDLTFSALRALLGSQTSDGGWPTWEDQRELDIEDTAIAVHSLALIRPDGWRKAVQRAARWLLTMQSEGGWWSDASAPDDVYLTVLVLDALELANGGSKVTFKLAISPIARATTASPFQYDAFISHAYEDKNDFVRPLARALSKLGFRIWFDEFELHVGDSLRRSIDKGLAKSAYGIVVLSKAFFAKRWSQYELDGLVAREMDGRKVILPVWHDVNRKQVMKYSPPLADKFASNSKSGLGRVVRDLVAVLKQRPTA